MTTSLRQLVLAAALGALAVPTLRADPAPWYPGDPGDRLAVVAVAPGDEVRFCGGLLQECDTLELPAHVFVAGAAGSPAAVRKADAALARPPDAFDILRDPAAQLPALLPAFAPSHLVLSQPTPALLDLVAAAFPDPASQPMLLVPAGDSAAADWVFSLTPAQTEAKNAALRAYGLPSAPSSSELFLELEFDPLAAAISAADIPSPHPLPEAPPPAASPSAPSLARSPSPVSSSPSSPPRLLPRTRLPASPPPPPPAPSPATSWEDELVRW